MIVVNFSHPITAEQRTQIESLANAPVDRVIDVPTHFDDAEPFAGQIAPLVAAAGLSPEEWQTLPLLVNLPSYAPIAAVLLAYLHGMSGHFPAVLRLRPIAGSPTTSYEAAEILRLGDLRTDVRSLVHGSGGRT